MLTDPAAAVPHAPPLHVALDLAHTRLAHAGVTRHALGLAEALAERDDVIVTRLGEGRPPGSRSLARRGLALQHDLHWYLYEARRAAMRAGASVYHCPALRGPITRGVVPFVVTAHDLTPITHPATLSRWNRVYSKRTVRRVLGVADRVIAVSQSTADDVLRLGGVPAERVRVIPNAVHSRFSTGIPGKPPVDGPYVLFVGTPEPRKNLPRLFEAMRKRRAAGAIERLVVAGGDGWGNVTVGRDTIALGQVDDETLHALYAHARCFVLPSLHEGFGIPAIEAMASGCPVVVSRAGALPEVCGDAAIFVDPYDTDYIASGIDAAIADADALRILGRERAEHFSWAAVARATVAVYRELL